MDRQKRAKLGIYRILTEQYNQKPEQAQQVLFEMFKEINLQQNLHPQNTKKELPVNHCLNEPENVK